jgi:hypothetical protein
MDDIAEYQAGLILSALEGEDRQPTPLVKSPGDCIIEQYPNRCREVCFRLGASRVCNDFARAVRYL